MCVSEGPCCISLNSAIFIWQSILITCLNEKTTESGTAVVQQYILFLLQHVIYCLYFPGNQSYSHDYMSKERCTEGIVKYVKGKTHRGYFYTCQKQCTYPLTDQENVHWEYCALIKYHLGGFTSIPLNIVSWRMFIL